MATNLESRRIMTKVARMYHARGMRQTEISSLLGISQARVSRLLSAAEDAKIVRTVVVIPDGLHAELEEALEERFGLTQAHVVEALDENDESGLFRDLGDAAATIFAALSLDEQTVGFTSWSSSLRSLAATLESARQTGQVRVVEMLGDVGPPRMQHEATRATQRLADQIGATPLFLRAPGVVASAEIREAIVNQDGHIREALDALDNLDIALVGIGTCEIDPPLVPGDNFFSEEQFALAKSLGAVGQVNLRFLDAMGNPIATELDELVLGVTLTQLRAARRRIGVAGGRSKFDAVRAAVRGGWIDTLITDQRTAERLLAD